MDGVDWSALVAATFAGLFAISEMLAMIPVVKSNSVFQWAFNLLKVLAGKGDD